MACSKQVEDNTDPSLSIIPQGVAIAEDYRLSPMNIAEYVELQATTMNVTTRAIRGMDVKAVMRYPIYVFNGGYCIVYSEFCGT